ncbi:mechanosensitive ion channel family protein [Maribacter hydrothermalis]|uniref:Mechanosensitive ion channel protein MscS n=1 Tax=Maribacter hydrothermalis TaxID=1836467 RepID=A0A1B7Z4B3_9FLAO|nr:mechanosensitive ion channel family protein [Maribacter hydrothermalis]APQ17284.1 mechanosensitive ion channel protein MscS [Maribacter hydrothermalis]OBR37543.1 mechanosensitive ion channel protein MscS [Maribacter hydrothermalis]
MQESTTTVTESISSFYNQVIHQLPGIGLGILIIVFGLLVGSFIGNVVKKRLSVKTKDPLMSTFLGKAIKYIFVIIAIMLGLEASGLGAIAAGILTAAGASAVVLGFAFKDIGQNFIAGIIMAFGRPFDIDDTVEIGENFGKVKALEFRYTKLKTFDGKDVYIPNSDVLTKPVTNYTEDGFYRWDFIVGIAYEDNIEGAKTAILQALQKEPTVIEDKEHQNFVVEETLATSTVNLKIYFWVDTKDFRRSALITRGNVIKHVKEELVKAGYYLPADIQEIKLYGKETEIPIKINKSTKE